MEARRKKSFVVIQNSNKDKRKDQLKAVYDSFFESPKTMKEVDKGIGIMRENICRYVKTMLDKNQIAVLRKRYCNVTKHLANEYTTNPDLFPKVQQLNLFNE